MIAYKKSPVNLSQMEKLFINRQKKAGHSVSCFRKKLVEFRHPQMAK
ncbi:hypothetical protein [Oscillospiraceae bacterium]|nr:hypothetical protein [Oscillospiraceae bacterium]